MSQPTVSSDQPEVIVQRQLDAYNARDLDALVSIYAPNAELYAFPSTLQAAGTDALRQRFAARFTEPDLYARLLRRTVMGDIVIDHEEITRNFPEGRGTLPMVCIYEVKEGHIRRGWFIPGPQVLEKSPAT